MVMLPGFVAGPPAEPQRGGLVANAAPGDIRADWRKGVQMWPEDVAGWQLSADCTTSVVNVDSVGPPRPVVAQPFMIRSNVKGPKSSHLDLSGRAERRLESVTSQAVAREFWLGEMAQAAPFTLLGNYDWLNPAGGSAGQYLTPYLASGQAVDAGGGSGLDPLSALAAVEDKLSDVVAGGPSYLYVPRGLVTELAQELTRVGDRITTLAGSYVITDKGFPSVGDTGGGLIYGSGVVQCWVGDITDYGQPHEYLNINNNEIQVWVDRPAMTIFDPLTLVKCAVAP